MEQADGFLIFYSGVENKNKWCVLGDEGAQLKLEVNECSEVEFVTGLEG